MRDPAIFLDMLRLATHYKIHVNLALGPADINTLVQRLNFDMKNIINYLDTLATIKDKMAPFNQIADVCRAVELVLAGMVKAVCQRSPGFVTELLRGQCGRRVSLFIGMLKNVARCPEVDILIAAYSKLAENRKRKM